MHLCRAHNKFALQFFQEAARDGKKPGNLAYTPLGISLGLGILYVGSRGVTLQELQQALTTSEVEDVHLLPAFAAIHWDILRSTLPKGCDNEAAVRLFVPEQCCALPVYEDLCQEFEISRFKRVDFENRPDLARKEINQWVDERTRGKIKDVVPPMGIVDRDISILLLSAMYFKVHFLRPFDKNETEDLPFNLMMKETLVVPTMHTQGVFKYCTSSKLECSILQLPMTNKYMKLLILLPKKVEGWRKTEEKLKREHFENALSSLKKHTVDIYLPKFHLQMGNLSGEILQKLGLRAIFGQGKADLSGIDGTRDLFLSKIYHYVDVEVDEGDPADSPGPSSTPDSPVTSLSSDPEDSASTSSKPGKLKTFRADHPFIYIIMDDRSGAVILTGRVVRPNLSS
ncbi:hypothetical protein CAPTEDRAFT_129241 [Capitella teleta]|uniref:Serpin domain-containing protein n=1 Tax=Capitella teleta TaxID=283909 RepID=R7UQL3_CAPTE|nr:hypothetical protein CAPTEDRAFT_129241 [Capitella teleta]|eukprot:ELU08819.1 hypothetical protein CAPTEDRAFT_129241 [Capitella teleta]